MLLNKIKLAGFKSFVDPTTLHFNNQLIGVVGPNGCGKSNIIDAVRWVMGESSAKTLRGDSMADVIFNGSSTRQPVGQASVELIFDNSDGSVKGEYAKYAEIAVRREVTRDGQSNYYLNNTRCRKRDIVDVFLGTGLGPRSYSIIEQGMISRIVEAKPDDLRAFFEEAAGISLYKKRRHETGIRMRHTRENLTRIADLCREQEIQLEKLQKQAEAAERYQEYQFKKKKIETELLLLRWQDYDSKIQIANNQIGVLTAQLEEKLSYHTNVTTKLEKVRLEHIEQTDLFNEVQSRFYDIGANIARKEQTLQHHQEQMQQLRIDLTAIQQQENEILAELKKDNSVLTELKKEFATIMPKHKQADESLIQEQNIYQIAKNNMQDWLDKWGVLQQQAHKLQQQTEVEKIRIEQLEKQTHEYQIRLDRLFQEKDGIDIATGAKKLILVENEFQTLELCDRELRQSLSSVNNTIFKLCDFIKQLKSKVDEVRGEIQVLKGKQASLEMLQQAALGKENQQAITWLKQHELTDLPRVAEQIQVASGWEKAVEVALGKYLEYICVENFADLVQTLPDHLELDIGLLDAKVNLIDNKQAIEQISLASKIKGNNCDALFMLLQKIYIAEDLNAALLMRPKLAVTDSVITRSGIWLGLNWLRIPADQCEHFGILHRNQELTTITVKLAELEQNLTNLVTELNDKENELVLLQEKQTTIQKEVQLQEQKLREKSNELSVIKTQHQNLTTRVEQIQLEINEYQQQMIDIEKAISQSRAKLEQSIEGMSAIAKERDLLDTTKEVLQNALTTAEQKLHNAREQLHQLAIAKHTIEAKEKALLEGIQRLNKQLEVIQKRIATITSTLSADNSPIETVKLELDTLLDKRLFVEEELHTARVNLESLDQTIADLEKDRTYQEKLAEEVRVQLDELKMNWQTLKVRCQTIEENLTEMQVEIKTTLTQLPLEANELEWNNNLERIIKKIDRLGPINLAAVSEYETESKRQKYLRSQQTDLEEALRTLEQAISKIDRETRSKFKNTFERVNENFKKLFPKLFGGGQAYIELTENDLLGSGITVMARPPGKKNSTIHLLSGGEKALAAIALVFSIFQLNPAPFCMLDEVDAPLDDANIERYCDMLREMSGAVQFIFITHNKLTMEIANQLAGVTMKEPGVSRLVFVDIDEAVEMAVA